MDMYDWLYSPSCALNEQIARQLFEVLASLFCVMFKRG
jgi:hypothetical protein